MLIGIVRPIILLPPAALTGWSPDEIEMVLLHELAHVRRWDNLVNLLQREQIRDLPQRYNYIFQHDGRRLRSEAPRF